MYCTEATADTAEWLLGHQGCHAVLHLLRILRVLVTVFSIVADHDITA